MQGVGEQSEEAIWRLTPSARRYQVRRAWVQIPMQATFFTHEISCIICAVEVVLWTCETSRQNVSIYLVLHVADVPEANKYIKKEILGTMSFIKGEKYKI